MVTTVRDTTINADNFEETYSSGLIFSMFEGLKEECRFQIVSSKNLSFINKLIEDAKIANLQLEVLSTSEGINRIEVLKLKKTSQECCGVCGG